MEYRIAILYHCMANLTIYLLKVEHLRTVDRHLRYPGKLQRVGPALPATLPSQRVRMGSASTMRIMRSTVSLMQRRKSNLKAKFQSGSSHFSFKRSVPGDFKLSLIGSTCAALP